MNVAVRASFPALNWLKTFQEGRAGGNKAMGTVWWVHALPTLGGATGCGGPGERGAKPSVLARAPIKFFLLPWHRTEGRQAGVLGRWGCGSCTRPGPRGSLRFPVGNQQPVEPLGGGEATPAADAASVAWPLPQANTEASWQPQPRVDVGVSTGGDACVL